MSQSRQAGVLRLRYAAVKQQGVTKKQHVNFFMPRNSNCITRKNAAFLHEGRDIFFSRRLSVKRPYGLSPIFPSPEHPPRHAFAIFSASPSEDGDDSRAFCYNAVIP